jgi:hypothetical protein
MAAFSNELEKIARLSRGAMMSQVGYAAERLKAHNAGREAAKTLSKVKGLRAADAAIKVPDVAALVSNRNTLPNTAKTMDGYFSGSSARKFGIKRESEKAVRQMADGDAAKLKAKKLLGLGAR